MNYEEMGRSVTKLDNSFSFTEIDIGDLRSICIAQGSRGREKE